MMGRGATPSPLVGGHNEWRHEGAAVWWDGGGFSVFPFLDASLYIATSVAAVTGVMPRDRPYGRKAARSLGSPFGIRSWIMDIWNMEKCMRGSVECYMRRGQDYYYYLKNMVVCVWYDQGKLRQDTLVQSRREDMEAQMRKGVYVRKGGVKDE